MIVGGTLKTPVLRLVGEGEVNLPFALDRLLPLPMLLLGRHGVLSGPFLKRNRSPCLCVSTRILRTLDPHSLLGYDLVAPLLLTTNRTASSVQSATMA